MTIYGLGLRVSEAADLMLKDIDSKSMRIFIRKGKGDRDRYALLPQRTLGILREYFIEHFQTSLQTMIDCVVIYISYAISIINPNVTPSYDEMGLVCKDKMLLITQLVYAIVFV